jgi:hypothetical protein
MIYNNYIIYLKCFYSAIAVKIFVVNWSAVTLLYLVNFKNIGKRSSKRRYLIKIFKVEPYQGFRLVTLNKTTGTCKSWYTEIINSKLR